MRTLLSPAIVSILASILAVHTALSSIASAESDDDANLDDCGVPTWDSFTINQYTARVVSFGTDACNGTGVYSYYFHPSSSNAVSFTVNSPFTGLVAANVSSAPSSDCVIGLPVDGGSLVIAAECLDTQDCAFQYGALFVCIEFSMDVGWEYELESISPPACENFVPASYTNVVYFQTFPMYFNGSDYYSMIFFTDGGVLYDDQVLVYDMSGAGFFQGQSKKAAYQITPNSHILITQMFDGHQCEISFLYTGQYNSHTTTNTMATSTTQAPPPPPARNCASDGTNCGCSDWDYVKCGVDIATCVPDCIESLGLEECIHCLLDINSDCRNW